MSPRTEDGYHFEREREEQERATLRLHNRWALAERQGWPEGALETCEQLDEKFPGWVVWWLPANTVAGWERPAGFSATCADHALVGGDELRRLPADGVRRALVVFAVDPAELPQRIAAMMEQVAEQEEQEERLRRWVQDSPTSPLQRSRPGR